MITATESIRDRRRLIQFESGRRLVRPESKPLRSRRESIDRCPAWAHGSLGWPAESPGRTLRLDQERRDVID
jgi:hypothetical protein